MKKSKVVKVTKYDKPDQYGNYSCMVEFENGDKGYYRTKLQDQKDFVQGSESEYELEEKEGKEGKKYFNVKRPQTFQKSGFSKGPDPKIQMIGFAMSYTKDLIVSNKVDLKDLETVFNRIHSLMSSKL